MELWDAYDAQGKRIGETLIRGEPIPNGRYHMVCEALVRHADGEYLLMQVSRMPYMHRVRCAARWYIEPLALVHWKKHGLCKPVILLKVQQYCGGQNSCLFLVKKAPRISTVKLLNNVKVFLNGAGGSAR